MPATSPEAIQARDDAKIAEYYERKAAGICVDCRATLPDDHDNVRCPECAEANRRASRAYRATDEGRATEAAGARLRYERRARAIELGAIACRKCGRTPTPGKKYCEKCRKANTDANREYRRRKRAGVTSLESVRRRKRAAIAKRVPPPRPAPELARVVSGEVLESTRNRILRALRFLDWTGVRDLFVILNVDESDGGQNKERDRFAQCLSRMSSGRRGFVERREAPTFYRGGTQYEYRITELGRAELRRLMGASC